MLWPKTCAAGKSAPCSPEEFNPAHDVCRAIACAARQAAGVDRGYAYLLEGRPDIGPFGTAPGAMTTACSADELSRKHAGAL